MLEVIESNWLPKTVRDKDGKELKLIAVFASPPVFDLAGAIDWGRIILWVDELNEPQKDASTTSTS